MAAAGLFGKVGNGQTSMPPPIVQSFPSVENMIATGSIVDFAQSKSGWAYLQKRIPFENEYCREKIYTIVLKKDVFFTLCVDPFGNFFMQKLMEWSTPMEHEEIVRLVEGRVVQFGCNHFGSRVIQKLWARLNDSFRSLLFGECQGREIHMAVDASGTHLMQRIIENAPISTYGPIVETFASTDARIQTVAKDRHGCRVLQLLFEKLGQDAQMGVNEMAMSLLKKLSGCVMRNFDVFVNHQYANYVIQCIITTPALHLSAMDPAKQLLGTLLVSSQEKYASHVVERVLECGTAESVQMIMEEILHGYEYDSEGSDALQILMFDHFGNYVVQKMFDIAIEVRLGRREGNSSWFDLLADRIRKCQPQLCKYSSGKRLLVRLENARELMDDRNGLCSGCY